jgi:hypothetical protein
MNTYGGGSDGQGYTDYDRKPPEAKVKVASPRDVLDPRDTRSPTDIQNLQTAQQNYKDASVAYRSDAGSPADKTKMDAANNTIMDARQNYGATTQYNTPKTTGLQKVQSAVKNTVGNVVDSLQSNKALQMAGTILGVPLSPLMTGAKVIAGSLTNEYQKDINNANKNALTSLGYKTNYELGNMSDPGRVAGNPAKDVFAGMNAVSAFGDISKGAQKRLDTRNSAKTQERMAKKSHRSTVISFLIKQQQTCKNKKMIMIKHLQKIKLMHKLLKQKNKKLLKVLQVVEAVEAVEAVERVICTDLHRTGELSTRDWIRDTKFTFKTLSITHVKGYLLWAEPTVKHIQKYPR